MHLRIGFFLVVSFIFGSISQSLIAQQDSTTWVFSGFLDVYYGYDFSQPSNNERPGFLYNHTRHNEVSSNLLLLNVDYKEEAIRVSAGLMAGTYVTYNMAQEPSGVRNIWQAQIGVKLLKKESLWLDAGVFPSHVGFESAISMENPTLSRSLAAENTPYYLSGGKLSWTKEQFEMALIIANGWQRIVREPGNSSLAYGSQLSWKFHHNWLLNSSLLIAQDYPDSLAKWRGLNNLFLQGSIRPNWDIIIGFDWGIEQRFSNLSTHWNQWKNPTIVNHFQLNSKLAIAQRMEYYHDPVGLIISSPVASSVSGLEGVSLASGSFNIDIWLGKGLMWRCEGRYLYASESIFRSQQQFSRSNFHLLSSLAWQWQKGF